ncbi:cytokine receptor-like isoform X1 [Diorhabda sublineata]|uniref:cytokine receptor-like isoform X1 n=1 Tax=Diorhabda sublineata TaxID=1163346 RepID=UPI0024E12AF7|nr:cytokine receptor-like isoform X1 [Diorhabda sublineata]XP_056647148.1 cytokine receptor-like isoform X1 [Diorhabda sublineata]
MYIMYVGTLLLILIVTKIEAIREKGHDKQNHPTGCFSLGNYGYTLPAGDVILRYGEPLNLTCTLFNSTIERWRKNNGYELSSADLYFYRNYKNIYPNNEYDLNNKRAEKVEIINETSIRLYIEKPDLAERDVIFCHFNDSVPKQYSVCTNVVAVGVPPQKVTDFSCMAINFEKLICTWTAPENYVRTQYEVRYKFKSNHTTDHNKNNLQRHHHKKKSALLTSFVCPSNTTDDSIISNMSCELSLYTTPQYRQSKRHYTFKLRANNTFGEIEQVYEFDHYKRMRPHPVENLRAQATSPHSILLTWMYTAKVDAFPERVEGKILYKCEFCNDSWVLDNNTFVSETFKKKITRYELKNLRYAHALYDIRVSIKPIEADEDMWSNYTVVTKRTESKVPDRSPSVTQGSFQVINLNNEYNRDVYVYFQSLKESEQNGQNFTYEVDIKPNATMVELTKTFVKFEKLHEDQEYVVRVWSKNEIGRSYWPSRVVIPKNSIPEPSQLIKIGHGYNSYKLQWEAPKVNQPITNYTLFWCMNDRDRPYQCTGYLNWTIVSNATRQFETTLTNDTYQFAIAANTENGSSGMRWAECTVLNNGTLGKIRNIWINSVGPNFIELRWKLDCSDIISEVIGYVIYYCKTPDRILPETGCGKDEIKNFTVPGDLKLQSATLPNLEPYTSYELALSIKSTNSLSPRSLFIRNVTSDSAPSTPPKITNITVTNASISLEWTPPEKANGRIIKYVIYYNDNKLETKPDTKKTIEGLESYKNYTISMKACNQFCSNETIKRTVTTRMGTPAKIGRPFVLPTNDSSGTMNNIISWDKPNPPRGELDYYQLKITGTNIDSEEITNFTNADNYTIQNCREAGYSFSVYLRAVNIIDGEHWPGPWSDPLQISCYKSSWYIMVILFVAILTFVMICIGCRRLYICWSIARHVEIKLPPGLAPAVEHPEKNSDIIDRNFDHDPDEELLLERMIEKYHAGDSSGCSSGQVSITSSVESTHLSVDSGTDQPRNVADDNKENSLRQRNVSLKGYVMHDAAPVVNRATKPVATPPGNYCLIGVDPSTKSPIDSPYVTINDLDQSISPYIAIDQPSSAPPPYTMTDIFKVPNPGYVPFSPKEPASKNTGYVVAGDLTSVPVPDAKTDYLVMDTQVGLKPTTVWQQPSIIEPSLTKSGYVTVGDAPPPLSVKDPKGYVSHRQFESKALKED